MDVPGSRGGCTDSGDVAIHWLRDALSRLAQETRARPRNGLAHHGADETVGTVGTDDAVGFDPLPLLRALYEFGAHVVVIGQVAGIMHGSRELTGDLDLLWDGHSVQADAMAAAFASVWPSSPTTTALLCAASRLR
ncbi:hypothetical protein [Actinopolymorpha cephalotaxi]|uniref:Uncharacterized protein n=1 Tax=Actinopolymorpha cephalotaxi TaxID=504797 RepID=A0ABX2S102_9ACTN|nr:hypothetical protein [Actinopolymorpha cephalotaxi]NYH83259.1 hypothetical protein [Actinopolymorpha cephalotaxi]